MLLWRILPLTGALPTLIHSLRMAGGCYPAAAENHSSVSLVHYWCLSSRAPLTHFSLLAPLGRGVFVCYHYMQCFCCNCGGSTTSLNTSLFSRTTSSNPLSRGVLLLGRCFNYHCCYCCRCCAFPAIHSTPLHHSSRLQSSVC